MAKTIYSFADLSDVRAVARLDRDAARSLLGGKGAGLFEMSRIGLPVPPGFTVTTAACRAGGACALSREFQAAVAKLEKAVGRKLGSRENPLLVSVRSGAKFSMPGMMDTILNLGLNDETVVGLAEQTGDPRFAWDCYRRFIAMYGNVVKGLPKEAFEAALRRAKLESGADCDAALTTKALHGVVGAFLSLYKEAAGEPFPQDPSAQLRGAVAAVFESWNNPRAAAYRRLNRIPEDLGTACTVQSMVFGNMGPDSATGVGFTRDPGTGERAFYGEFLVNAQGEDVVAGVRTPKPLSELADSMPKAYGRLREISAKLERHYGDVQDLEFTIERGRLFMLQTRTGKRSALAALRIAVDMVEEGLITPEQALMRLTPEQLDELLRPVFDEAASAAARVLARGLPAGPGAATGRAFFSADRAVAAAKDGPVILVRPETNPDDIHGMAAAEGILTATGGMTSHAAVVGRGMGKVCVVGCAAFELDEARGEAKFAGETLREGDWVSLDGFKGRVLAGRVATQPSEILEILLGRRPEAGSDFFRRYKTFMSWADAARALAVRANADTPADARAAVALGAAGIGLCRTEHMFFGEDRVPKVLAMILAGSREERAEALEALYPLQKEDFKEIFLTMRGLPVTIRTIDPPLHEFLPRTREDAERAAAQHGLDASRLWAKALELREANPMLGHRGCRLGITYPEITDMQARAILSAACEAALEGSTAVPEIMIPLVGHAGELRHQRERIAAVAQRVFAEQGVAVPYQVGTMIEVPRAALTAGEIAEEAEFFSFGTNDLTQMTLGYSRDDYGRYIGEYLDRKILSADPFRTLDRDGVGRLVRLAVEEGRRARPLLKIGVCGEHGGDPASIAFFHDAGLAYVSCSPYRVPVARLAAARAAVSAPAAPRRPARPLKARAAALAAALLLALPAGLRANPTDGVVAAGSASIGSSGSTLSVLQTSQNAIINWGGFSIGAGELTQFLQPSAGSAVLNRVTGGDPSSILGTLQANGKVFLINPNGIAVGPGGVINTQSFVASTLNLDDASFMAGGPLLFAGDSAAGIVNAGRISALGGDIGLFARTVRNTGELSAPGGTVGLAAGSEVLFQPDGAEKVFVQAGSGSGGTGIDQAGAILAASAELKAAGGNVYSLAINNTGVVQATGVERRGGRVYLVAEGGEIALGAGSVLDASGAAGGGSISVEGGHVDAERGAALRADSLESGDGGTIVVRGSREACFEGSLSARGGPAGGDGGFAEVSSPRLAFAGTGDFRAPNGALGGILLDPFDISISNLAVNDASHIQDSVLVGLLQNGNVTVATGDNGLPDGGDITIEGGASAANLVWDDSAGGGGTLTLNANRNISVLFGSVIDSRGAGGVVFNANGGAGTITLKSDVTTAGGAQAYNGRVIVRKGDEYLTSHGGAVSFSGPIDPFTGVESLFVDAGGGDVSLGGPVSLAGLSLFGRDVTLGGGVATTGAGGVLVVAGRSFLNPGSAAISTGGGGRFLIYSVDPSMNALGGLTGSSQFGTTFAGGPAPAFSGNGFLYSSAAPALPVLPPFDRSVFSNDRVYGDGYYTVDNCRKRDGKRDFECGKEEAITDSTPDLELFSRELGAQGASR